MAQEFDPGATATGPSRPDPVRAGARPALMVTWSVGETFGGMTAMCLKRASLFHERGVPSAVVSFNPAPEFASIRTALVAAKKLHPEVPIINLHEYYASVVDELVPAQQDPREHKNFEWNHHSSTKREADGSILYTDHSSRLHGGLSHREYFRPDGTIYLTDSVLPLAHNSQKTRRVLRLLDPQGGVRGEFAGASELYKHWLAELVGETATDVIVDSKFSAGFLWSFEHPLAMKFVNFHSTHVAAGADPLTGKLSEAHQGIISNRENWDGITFLTKSQRQAFVERFGDQGNTVVISNPVDGPAVIPEFAKRDRTKVLHVGRFTKGKNVSEVIEIVRGVASGGTAVSLDLIGEGEQHKELAGFGSGFGDGATLSGSAATSIPWKRNWPRQGCSSSAANSRASPWHCSRPRPAGCVPVSYDVNFGPRDVIEQDSTGFLVPFHDREAAVRAVTRLLTDDALCEEMSLNAFNLAKNYTSDAIFDQWIQALDSARAKQSARKAIVRNESKVIRNSFPSRRNVGD